MIYLLIAVVTAAALVLIFKIFSNYGIPIFPAIVVNYVSATLCAFIFLPDKNSVINGAVFHQSWVPLALFLGSMFILVFNLTSVTTVKYGVSTASVAMKLGLVFPVMLAFFLYQEPFNWIKLVGILLAFAAVVLSSIKQEEGHQEGKPGLPLLPILVFAGSGACDSLTQFANKRFVSSTGMEEFSFFLFVAAAIAGLISFSIGYLGGKTRITLKSFIGGAILGIVNYISFFFLLKTLGALNWGSSVLFPLINLCTVAFATACGIVFFRERISKINALGLVFAAASITVIILSAK